MDMCASVCWVRWGNKQIQYFCLWLTLSDCSFLFISGLKFHFYCLAHKNSFLLKDRLVFFYKHKDLQKRVGRIIGVSCSRSPSNNFSVEGQNPLSLFKMHYKKSLEVWMRKIECPQKGCKIPPLCCCPSAAALLPMKPQRENVLWKLLAKAI